jgi:hypothetical protein
VSLSSKVHSLSIYDRITVIIICISLVAFASCATEKYVDFQCKTLLQSDSITLPNLYIEKLKHSGRIDTDYGFRVITIDSMDYLTCLISKSNQILGVNLNTPFIYRNWNIALPKFVHDNYQANFFISSRDSLFFACIDTKEIYSYKFDKLDAVLFDSTAIKNFDSKTFFSMNYGSNAQISYNNANSFKLIFNYGIIKNPKGNYVDTNNIIEINENGGIKKFGKYPQSFKSEYKPYYHSLFKMINDSICVTTYLLDNQIYIVNKNNNDIVTQAYIGNPKAKKFEKARTQDLGYQRNYLIENGINCKIEVLNENNIVILKRLAGKLTDTKDFYKYLVLDKNLNVKYCDTIKHSISPYFLQKHKNGFFLMGAGFDKLFYYYIK